MEKLALLIRKLARGFVILILSLLFGALVLPCACLASYDDAAPTDWFYPSVVYVTDRKALLGVTSKSFKPEMTLTRARYVEALYRLSGSPPPASKNPFSDVDNNYMYAAAIRWAAEENITVGVGSNCFAPYAIVTREEAASMLYRYLCRSGVSVDIHDFRCSDYDEVSTWAKDAVAFVAEHGLFHEEDIGVFLPKQPLSRADAAYCLMKLDQTISCCKNQDCTAK